MSRFNGTSAATPHVAGAAALALDADPTRTPDQLETFLAGRALDVGPTGADTISGAGRLHLGTPPASTADTTAPTGTVSINGGAAWTRTTGVQLSIAASDAGSGVSHVRFSNDGGAWTAYEAYIATKAWTLGATNGTRRVSVQFRDAAGNESVAASDTIGLDTVAPAVTAPRSDVTAPSALAASGSATVPVRVSWSGSDATSGLQRYRLYQSVNGAAYGEITLSPVLSTTKVVYLTPGSNTYRFATRSYDNAGNASALTAGPTFTTRLLEETTAAPTVAFSSGWTSAALTGASGGYVRYSSTAGHSVTVSTSASGLALVSAKGPNRGKVAIYVDGATTPAATVDLYASTQQTRQIVFARTFSGTLATHSLKVVVLGSRNAASTANRADVDAFVALR